MNRRTAVPLLACVALLLSGCHHAYRASVPDTTRGCVDGLTAVPPHALTYLLPKEDATERRREFADVAACVTLDGTRLPVALYGLEGLEGRSTIDIRVQLSEGGTFAASAELLDAGFQPVRRYPFTDFVRRTGEYSLSVFVDRTAATAPRYLLLRPDPEKVGKHDEVITSQSGAFMMPGGGYYSYGQEVTRQRPLLGAGQLQVVPYPATGAAFE